VGEKIEIGDYGEISFTIRKKRKEPVKGEDNYITTGFILVGRIIDVDSKNIMVLDNDDMEYLVTRSRIRSFTLMDEKK